jgi:hypothetical protein
MADMPMPEPQAEHKWLEQLVGDWTYESECVMGPDQPPMTGFGAESVKSLGGLWVLGEGTADTPGGTPMNTVLTLGFDKGRFVGTFVASCMTMMWHYAGALDAAGKVLTLDCDGPNFADPTKTSKYQDIHELLPDGRRTLTSRCQMDDGSWVQFMKATYTRKA